MQPNLDELEILLAHEARYFEIWSRVTRAEQVWFLDSSDMPNYHSANRALRLRYANETQRERGPESVVAEIIGHYRGRGLPVVVDVDPIAEDLGFGRALRLRGVTPVIGSMLLMRFPSNVSPPVPVASAAAPCVISVIPHASDALPHLYSSDNNNVSASARCANSGNNLSPTSVNIQRESTSDIQEWIHLAGSDEDTEAEAQFWKQVASREAASPDCRLYLARVEGKPAGACQLFTHAGWGLIDSVITHPHFRRRGIASRLVAQAIQDSRQSGNAVTYLYTEQGSAGEQVYRRLGFEVWGIDTLRRHILF